jgi:sigma-B regulation protein RsbU (phosphoserine phosphatase)
MNVSDARILVVDDIADNRDLLMRRLRRLGVLKITEASDGAEALEAIFRENFDLVLLDIMMPNVSGFEVLERLNAAGRLADLPIVVVSALNEIDPVVRCIELGAEDFIFKPLNPTLLRARVLATLEKKFLRDATRDELRRKRSELAEARILQLALKPAGFDGPFGGRRLRVDTILEPALEVGGDIVDHFRVSDSRWAILIGDVSDKGAGAALMMARTHALFRSLSSSAGDARIFDAPENAVGLVNVALSNNNARYMFVTLFFAILDVATSRLLYVRAGHVIPFLRHADGSTDRLSAGGGIPLGIDEKAHYTSAVVDFVPGDELVAVTDGITEAFDADEAAYGEDKLEAFVKRTDRSRIDMLADLLASVRLFAGERAQSDDIAAIHLVLHDA